MSDESEEISELGDDVAIRERLEHDKLDDVVVPFKAVRAGARGRLIRLGSAVDEILTAHEYPEPVAIFLGQAIALTAMIGSALKFDGKLIMQTKSDGPIHMLVVDYSTSGSIRAYASFDKALVAATEMDVPLFKDWIGEGYMALTVDQGPDMERYQGIVALEGETLGEVAEAYFRQSEQIPSLVRLSVAKHYTAEGDAKGEHWHWRAGGLMVQYLTKEGGNPSEGDPLAEESEDWQRARILGASVEPHELLDPELSPERLLYRLYHEEGVRIFDIIDVEAACSCSRERVQAMLSRFSSDERRDMVESGEIGVNCEFCNKFYSFGMEEFS